MSNIFLLFFCVDNLYCVSLCETLCYIQPICTLNRYCLKKKVVVTPTVLIKELHFPSSLLLYNESWRLTDHARLSWRGRSKERNARPLRPRWTQRRSHQRLKKTQCHFHRYCGLDSVLSLCCWFYIEDEVVSSQCFLSKTFVPFCLWSTFVALLSLSNKGMWLLSKHRATVFCCCFLSCWCLSGPITPTLGSELFFKISRSQNPAYLALCLLQPPSKRRRLPWKEKQKQGKNKVELNAPGCY